MSIVVWIILGLVAGLLAGGVVGGTFYSLIGATVIGIIGALVGGWLGSMWLGLDMTEFSLISLALSAAGAIVVLLVFRAIVRPTM